MHYTAIEGQVTCGMPIGIIMMDTLIPFPPGTPGNASGLPFAPRYRLVRGASMSRVIYEPDPAVGEELLAAGRELVAEGVRAVVGNCGFMVLYQEKLAAELPVPVCMSSLMQLPFVSRLLRPGEKVGIITASERCLTAEHLRIAANGAEIPVRVAGLDDQPAFKHAVLDENGTMDFEAVEREVAATARGMVEADPSVRALLFECTDLPPYAAATQEATGLPVFDWSTLADHLLSAVVHRRFQGYV